MGRHAFHKKCIKELIEVITKGSYFEGFAFEWHLSGIFLVQCK